MTDTLQTTIKVREQDLDKVNVLRILRTMPESKRALAIAYMAGMEMRGVLDKEEKGA